MSMSRRGLYLSSLILALSCPFHPALLTGSRRTTFRAAAADVAGGSVSNLSFDDATDTVSFTVNHFSSYLLSVNEPDEGLIRDTKTSLAQLFPKTTQGENGISLMSLDGSGNHFELSYISDYFFGSVGAPWNIPKIYAIDPVNGIIGVEPSAVSQVGAEKDAVIKTILNGDYGKVRVTGEAYIDGGATRFYIYKSFAGYTSPIWEANNSGAFDLLVPYSDGDELFFAVDAGADDVNDWARWKNICFETTDYDGVFNIESGTGSGTGFSFSDPNLTITDSGNYLIYGVGTEVGRNIFVNTGVTATVTLDDVNAGRFHLDGTANVTMILKDGSVNTIRGTTYQAAVRVPSGSTLTIQGEAAGTGKLSAIGGSGGSVSYAAAGIGGSVGEDAGTIVIKGGVINAWGGSDTSGPGAGIGGGGDSGHTHSGGIISISGGTVTAYGGNQGGWGSLHAPGIGGYDATLLNISGGNVTAVGSDYGIYASTLAIGGDATVLAYSGRAGEPAIAGTTASSGHSAYFLSFSLDAAVSADTEITIENGGSTESLELTLPAGYRNFAVTVATGNDYTATLSDDTMRIVAASDNSADFPGICEAPEIALSSFAVKLHEYHPVAQIVGGNEYESLSEALTAVTDGQTIQLLDDISYTGKITASDKSFEIDMNDKTLSVSTTADNAFSATNGKTLSISGGGALNINVNTVNSYTGLYATGAGSTVAVDSSVVTTVTASGAADYGVTADSGGTVRMTGSVTVSNSAFSLGVYSVGPGSLTEITGPVSGGWVTVYTANGGEADITGDVTCTLENGYGVHANSSTVTVTGNISATGGGNYGVFANDAATVTVTGNISSGSVGISAYAGSTVTLNGGISAYGYYIQIGYYGNYLSAGSYEAVTTKEGYLTYTDEDSSIWVKAEFWTDGIASNNQFPFGGGDGSSLAQAYAISSPEQLAQLAYDVNAGNNYQNKYIVLTADINLTGRQWVPIGKAYGVRFEGNFDGCGHSISGLTMTKSSGADAYGLFGNNGISGVIADITVLSGEITFTVSPGSYSFGTIAGHNLGLVDSCVNKIDVTAILGESDWTYVGGIVGTGEADSSSYAWSGRISNCRNEGTVTLGPLGSVGGIIGNQWGGNTYTRIINCSNIGDVTGGMYTEVGGIAGRCNNGWSDCIYNCYNTGAVTTGASGSVSAYAGGIIGYQYASRVANCYNTGTVTNYGFGGNIAAGGITGYSYGYLFNVYNVGQVAGPSGYTGGICGSRYDAYSLGNCFYLDSSAPGAISGYSPSGTLSLTDAQMKGLTASAIGDYGPAVGALLYTLNQGRAISAENPENLWYWSSDTGEDNDGYPVHSAEEVYVVSFDSNGEGALAAQTVHAGSSIATAPTASLTGFVLTGWFTSKTGGTKVSFPYTPTDHTILYAQWSQSSSGGGGGGAVVPTITVTTTRSGGAIVNSTETDAALTSGSAKATLTKAITDALLEKSTETGGTSKDDLIKVIINTPDNIQKIQISIPQREFDRISSETDAGFAIESALVGITFDGKAMETISGAETGGNVVITAQRLPDLNGCPVYDLTVTNGNTAVSDFNGGHATVTIPYTLKPGENPNAVVIYYLADDGTLKAVRGHYNTELKAVVFKTTHFSKFTVRHNPVAFVDVPAQAWYKDAVDFIAARGITSGTGAGSFSPDDKLTRGAFVVLLMNAYGITPDAAPLGTENFADAGNTYYTQYLLTAKRLGIVNGIGNNLYAPDQPVTRQEMFVILYNALKAIEEVPDEVNSTALSGFDDAAQIAPWANEALTALVHSGTVTGYQNCLSPNLATTRAEVAQVLFNLLTK